MASLKDIAIKIFHEAGFNFLKWYSKVPTLVGKEYVHETDQLFAKQQSGVKLNETKMVCISFKKNKDFSAVEIPSEIKKLTNWIILQKLASICDPLDIISPTTTIGNSIYCDIWDSKTSWDKTLLDRGRLRKVGEEANNKPKHTKNNQFVSRNFRDGRYPCIWRCEFAWNIFSIICSHMVAIWNQTRIKCNQIKIVKKTVNNTNTGISSSTDGSKFSRQDLELFAILKYQRSLWIVR